MQYFIGSRELTEIEARTTLRFFYNTMFIDYLMDNEICFRLRTPQGDIHTKDERGMVPMPGFYGYTGGNQI